jgi:hypothetical protein
MKPPSVWTWKKSMKQVAAVQRLEPRGLDRHVVEIPQGLRLHPVRRAAGVDADRHRGGAVGHEVGLDLVGGFAASSGQQGNCNRRRFHRATPDERSLSRLSAGHKDFASGETGPHQHETSPHQMGIEP